MLKGFRVADVVVGRVGGLLSVLELVVLRVVEEAGVLDVVDEDVGRFEVAVPDTGRLEVVVALGLVLEGEVFTFSFEASGLDLETSSLPESKVDPTGVAGGAFSTSSAGMSAGTGTGSSVDAMLIKSN